MSKESSEYHGFDEAFRDSISTVDKEGKRIWIFPKKPSGFFYRWRVRVSYLLLALLFSGPFLKWDGQTLFMFNIIERKFILFGQTFWPQDAHLFALAFLIGVLFVIVFTLVFGRLFCGWICPQTIFMEMVFRRIEYLIEGDYHEQMRLNKAPWNFKKIRIKGLKYLVFFGLSFLISNIFLAYIIGGDTWIHTVIDKPSHHWGGLISIIIFTFVFLFVFAWLREQVCTTICPYGRLQGVLMDKNSMVVAYDHVRGEQRSKIHKGEDRAGKGDCIDCKLCVHVCPTGIDIRNGTQLECTNCTACIDACDEVMDKVGFQKNLIKYSSEAHIANNEAFKFTFRIVASSIVLLILLSLLMVLLMTRKDIETTILRTPGMLYQEVDQTHLSNLYNYKIVNKSDREMAITLKLISPQGDIKIIGKPIFLTKQHISEGTMFVIIDEHELTGINHEIVIGIYAKDELLERVSTKFIGKM